MKRLLTLLLSIALTACSSVSSTPTTGTLPTAPVTDSSPIGISSTETSSPTSVPESDPFTGAGITLPAPACETGLTPTDQEGPYYKAGTPERNSLFEEGMTGTRLILAGCVLDQDCQPVPNDWLDFWQADANGNFDNSGYTLRGHQFTDEQGRYFLETIAPGLYPGRPIIHIHVKVQPPEGQLMTTQIYFPDQPIQEQTATLEERDGYLAAYFNFVVQR
ncbi:MAG: intradiol ring-cleavage dioxygenase [Chloroflexi bacterium]|nr:intradiol ring-cleavage dioxygenase [Chloroflexota bacterium]